MKLQNGDYVLATKYHDGDPCDHFAVGFYNGSFREDRHDVVDSVGNSFRGNGFRRVEQITEEEGAWILGNVLGDVPGPSVWSQLEHFRSNTNTANEKVHTAYDQYLKDVSSAD